MLTIDEYLIILFIHAYWAFISLISDSFKITSFFIIFCSLRSFVSWDILDISSPSFKFQTRDNGSWLMWMILGYICVDGIRGPWGKSMMLQWLKDSSSIYMKWIIPSCKYFMHLCSVDGTHSMYLIHDQQSKKLYCCSPLITWKHEWFVLEKTIIGNTMYWIIDYWRLLRLM